MILFFPGSRLTQFPLVLLQTASDSLFQVNEKPTNIEPVMLGNMRERTGIVRKEGRKR